VKSSTCNTPQYSEEREPCAVHPPAPPPPIKRIVGALCRASTCNTPHLTPPPSHPPPSHPPPPPKQKEGALCSAVLLRHTALNVQVVQKLCRVQRCPTQQQQAPFCVHRIRHPSTARRISSSDQQLGRRLILWLSPSVAAAAAAAQGVTCRQISQQPGWVIAPNCQIWRTAEPCS
jgi:hypothetical protein